VVFLLPENLIQKRTQGLSAGCFPIVPGHLAFSKQFRTGDQQLDCLGFGVRFQFEGTTEKRRD
jgi:hypothetical protein